MKTIQSAGIVVVSHEESDPTFLLLLYELGHWDFPKGHIEPGEDEKTAALRELEEETGITDIKLDPEFFHDISYQYTYEGTVYAKTVHFFLGTTTPVRVTLSEEHKDAVWLPILEAIDQATFQNAKEVLRAAAKHLKLLE